MFIYVYIYVITLLLPIQPICKIVCLNGWTRFDTLSWWASSSSERFETLTTLNLLRKDEEPSWRFWTWASLLRREPALKALGALASCASSRSRALEGAGWSSSSCRERIDAACQCYHKGKYVVKGIYIYIYMYICTHKYRKICFVYIYIYMYIKMYCCMYVLHICTYM